MNFLIHVLFLVNYAVLVIYGYLPSNLPTKRIGNTNKNKAEVCKERRLEKTQKKLYTYLFNISEKYNKDPSAELVLKDITTLANYPPTLVKIEEVRKAFEAYLVKTNDKNDYLFKISEDIYKILNEMQRIIQESKKIK